MSGGVSLWLLTSISLLTGDVEHLSTYTVDIWASSSLKWLFETLDHLKFWFCPSRTWFVVLFYHRGLGVLRYMYCKYRLSLHNCPLISWWCLLMDTKFLILQRNVSISFFSFMISSLYALFQKYLCSLQGLEAGHYFLLGAWYWSLWFASNSPHLIITSSLSSNTWHVI